MDLKEFKEKYPDIAEALIAEGREEGKNLGFEEGKAAGIEEGKIIGRKEGAEAERKRIKAVEEQTLPGHEALIEQLKWDGTTTGEQAAVKVLQAEKAKASIILKNLEADAIDPVPVDNSAGDAPGGSTAPLPEGPEKWKADYAASKELQKEFRDVETYIAFKTGESQGRIKIFGKK